MRKAEIDREIDRALARGRRRAVSEPQAERAHYERRTGRVVVDLTNGCSFVFPARSLQGLAQATDAELAELETALAAAGIDVPELSADGFYFGAEDNAPVFRVYGGLSLSLFFLDLDAQAIYVPLTSSLGAQVMLKVQF